MLEIEREGFLRRKAGEIGEARQRVAFQIACGLDIADALSAKGARRAELLRKLDRAIERERIKGLCRHWGYDLNRHIALKQFRDRLCPDRKGKAHAHRRGGDKTQAAPGSAAV